MNDNVSVRLEVIVGAGDNRLRLGTLALEKLNVNAVAGDTEVDLGESLWGRFDATIVKGAGALTPRVPRESSTRISVQHGVWDIRGSGLVMTDGGYSTVGFNSNIPQNWIEVRQGVGSVLLEAV